jgi:hypothetical protein
MAGIKIAFVSDITIVRAVYEQFREFQEGLGSEQSMHLDKSSPLYLTGYVSFASIAMIKVHIAASLFRLSFHCSRNRGQGYKYNKCRNHASAWNPTREKHRFDRSVFSKAKAK